jgi:hypothetical protein
MIRVLAFVIFSELAVIAGSLAAVLEHRSMFRRSRAAKESASNRCAAQPAPPPSAAYSEVAVQSAPARCACSVCTRTWMRTGSQVAFVPAVRMREYANSQEALS